MRTAWVDINSRYLNVSDFPSGGLSETTTYDRLFSSDYTMSLGDRRIEIDYCNKRYIWSFAKGVLLEQLPVYNDPIEANTYFGEHVWISRESDQVLVEFKRFILVCESARRGTIYIRSGFVFECKPAIDVADPDGADVP